MKQRRPLTITALGLSLFVASASVSAQSVTPGTADDAHIAEARAEFDRGVVAARAERWGEALLSFRRVYDATHIARVLLNIGGALVASGRLIDGADAYRHYLRETPPQETELRASTETALAALERRIPHANVTFDHLLPDDEVAIDGGGVTHAAMRLPLALDPGRHVLVVSRAHHEIARYHFELIERREERIALALPTAAVHGQNLVRSPLFIAGLSVLAVGAVVAIGVGVYAATDTSFVGNVGPGWTRAP